ncbi:hypothetical protein [Undibacterium flavidum]|uniref:Immunity protein 30 of polymorphic toxin system n=1 Tax=Undibacterium flavidum TaxID=2762297 RepID=A0ABR6Y9L8_9BURK|nr:hypothetical protein [Undibacterium flavidum]MBC3872917.1 hypothetical protein [Undibacterium flavidum]
MNQINLVISALEKFELEDEDTNICNLYEILEGFKSHPDRELAIDAIFSFLEKYPEELFGSPGPLVHALESTPEYQNKLSASLKRQPTEATVHMVNRILNSEIPASQRNFWLLELEHVKSNIKCPDFVAESAREFLEYQRNNGNA